MDCWQILSIKQTTDVRAIKRAYAIQLKRIDTDQDADCFIALREAFESALEQALNLINDSDHYQSKNQSSYSSVASNSDTRGSNNTSQQEDDIAVSAHFYPNAPSTTTANLHKQYIEQLSHAMWRQQIDHDVFEKFTALCDQLPEMSLGLQFYFKEQLLPVLADIQTSPLEPLYMRFLMKWYDTFPEEIEHYTEVYYPHLLQQKIIKCLQHQKLWRNIPPHLESTVQLLGGRNTFYPIRMLKLQIVLIKYLGYSGVMEQLKYLHLAQTEINPNYLYLKSLNSWYKSIWANLIFVLNTLLLLSILGVSQTLNLCISLITAIMYIPLVQAPLQALICSTWQQDQRLENISILWFVTGIALLASPTLLLPIWHLNLSYAWVLFTLVLLSSLQLTALPYMNRLLQSDFYETDRWIMLLGCAGIICIASSAFYLLSTPHFPWLINFSLISLALFFLPDSLTGLAQRFATPFFSIFNIKLTILRSLSLLLLRFGLIFMGILFFSTGAIKIYLLLACLSFGCLFLAMLQARWLSSTLKYVSYAVLFILTLPTLFFPVYFAYYAYQSYKRRQNMIDTI